MRIHHCTRDLYVRRFTCNRCIKWILQTTNHFHITILLSDMQSHHIFRKYSLQPLYQQRNIHYYSTPIHWWQIPFEMRTKGTFDIAFKVMVCYAVNFPENDGLLPQGLFLAVCYIDHYNVHGPLFTTRRGVLPPNIAKYRAPVKSGSRIDWSLWNFQMFSNLTI